MFMSENKHEDLVILEMSHKLNAYEESGVREYWIVSPEYGHVDIFLLKESGKFVGQPPK